MNKKYYLALAATAALFAGCSSDDNFADESRMAEINDGDKAAIELLIGNPAGTRGTGTVGALGSDAANNKWGGQQFNVYMLVKGSLNVAKDADNHDIYNNTVFTAPNELAGIASTTPAMDVTATADGGLVVDSKVSYFPQEGNFDFWAYRTDGAEGANVPAVSGTSMVLDFSIDGTQDIMTAKAVPNVVANADGTYGAKNVPESRIFSAYSVRREVKPMLNFQHQLARIAFKVKGSKDLCDKAANPASGIDVANDLAVKVTAIKLKSLATGKLHVAYTANPAEIIEWTANSEAVLPLKQRGQEYTHAVIEWASAAVASGATVTFPSSYQITATADQVVYTSQALDVKKGQPLAANASTFGAEDAAGNLANCWFYHEITAPVAGAISVNADLVDLEPVAPIWNTADDEAFATPVGEALLVAPQLNYELTVETSQKVPETTKTYYCNYAQNLYSAYATVTQTDEPNATNYDAATADEKFDVEATATAADIEKIAKYLADGTYYVKIKTATPSYKKVVVDESSEVIDEVYYFATEEYGAAAEAAYYAWVSAATPTDAQIAAKDAALAKGSATAGKAVVEVLTYTVKNDSKTITLNGPSTTVGSTTTYKPYKANMSYTITLTLAGMESITGGNDNVGIGGYQVDTEGSEFDIDMDEEPSLP